MLKCYVKSVSKVFEGLMKYNFKSYNPNQLFLMPQSLDEWLPQNHLARLISEAVDQMDLSGLFRAYRANGQGSAAYHPAMMTKILLYAYCMGMPSSRKIAKALVDDVAFRWLAAGNFPDFRTISEFRRRHLKALRHLFPQILLLCKAAGLVKAGIIALDGTKVKGNARLSRNRTYEQLSQEEKLLKDKVEELLSKAESIDIEEDSIYGDRQGDELSDELDTTRKRLEKIRKAKKILEEKAKEEAEAKAKELEARRKEEEETGRKRPGRHPKEPDASVRPDARINMTDFDSRIQKNAKGYLQGFNAQAVATEDQVIVACDVVNEANDYHQFQPMLDQAQKNLSELESPAKTILADAGYCSEDNLTDLDSREDIEGLISTRKEREMRKVESTPSSSNRCSEKYMAMDKKLQTPVRKYVYRFRKRIIEPVFGQMKYCHGFSGFMLRGLEKVKCEFSLWCSAHNLLKLHSNSLKKAVITA